MERAIEIRESSDTVRELTPVLFRESTRRFRDRIARSTPGDTIELVVPVRLIDQLQEDSQYSSMLEPIIDSNSAEVYAHPGDIPWLLSLLDGCILFGTFDDDGHPVALIETSHPEIIAWAESRYRAYLDESDYLSAIPSNRERNSY